MLALVAAIIGAVCWGVAPIFGKLGLARLDPMTGLCARTLFAATIILGWLAASGTFDRLVRAPPAALVLIGIEAILATLAGDLAYFTALKLGRAGDTSMVMATSPLVTVVFAALILNERMGPIQLAGAVLIAVGLALLAR
jgi:transporter family protein